MHRFVAEDAGRRLGEIAVGEERHRAEIGAHRALLEARRKPQNIGLRLQSLHRKAVLALRRYGFATQLLHRLREHIRVLLMVTLELHGEREDRPPDRQLREPLRPRPCHNDLLNGNFIDDGTRIRILDWEYAGMGDIFFDLGNFAVQHEFTVEQDDILLYAYFGNPTDSQHAHLKLMKIMSDLREAMWGVVQVGVSKLDFDYVGYAQKYFDRYEASIKGNEYQRWLKEV